MIPNTFDCVCVSIVKWNKYSNTAGLVRGKSHHIVLSIYLFKWGIEEKINMYTPWSRPGFGPISIYPTLFSKHFRRLHAALMHHFNWQLFYHMLTLSPKKHAAKKKQQRYACIAERFVIRKVKGSWS